MWRLLALLLFQVYFHVDAISLFPKVVAAAIDNVFEDPIEPSPKSTSKFDIRNLFPIKWKNPFKTDRKKDEENSKPEKPKNDDHSSDDNHNHKHETSNHHHHHHKKAPSETGHARKPNHHKVPKYNDDEMYTPVSNSEEEFYGQNYPKYGKNKPSNPEASKLEPYKAANSPKAPVKQSSYGPQISKPYGSNSYYELESAKPYYEEANYDGSEPYNNYSAKKPQKVPQQPYGTENSNLYNYGQSKPPAINSQNVPAYNYGQNNPVANTQNIPAQAIYNYASNNPQNVPCGQYNQRYGSEGTQPAAQYSAPPMAKPYSPPPAQQYSAAPAQQYSAAPAQQYSAAPAQQYSQAPALQYSQAPAPQYSQAPAPKYPQAATQQYSQTPENQYSQTPVQKYSQGLAPQYSQAAAQQYSEEPAQQYSPAPVQQYSPAPAQQYSPAPAQQYSQAPAQQYSPPATQQYSPPLAQQYTSPPAQSYSLPQIEATPAEPTKPYVYGMNDNIGYPVVPTKAENVAVQPETLPNNVNYQPQYGNNPAITNSAVSPVKNVGTYYDGYSY